MNAIDIFIANAGNIFKFLKDFTTGNASDVSITHVDINGANSVKTFPNIAKQIQTLEDWKNNTDKTYAGKKYETVFVGTKGLNLLKDEDGNYLNASDGAKFEEEKDTFYPVSFNDVSWYQTKTILNINRSLVHLDNNLHGNSYGSLHFEAQFHGSSCGHGCQFERFKHLRHEYAPARGFIAKYIHHYSLGLVLWMRGQCTYHVSENGFPYVPQIGMDGLIKTGNACGDYNYQPLLLSDITDTTQNIVIS